MTNNLLRKPISKRLRFEVFKRDSFKCHYCGATAPDVLLQVDHITPVSKEGTNEIVNLITACANCNLGKSNILLDDKSAVAKSRNHLEYLQERREQLEMMLVWQENLRDLDLEVVEKLCSYWQDLARGWEINENGRTNIKKWLRAFSAEEIVQGMNVAAERYLKYQADGSATQNSWEEAFSKIPAIIRVERTSQEQPDLKDIYYIRGILRKNILYYYDDAEALEWLKIARGWDIPVNELKDIARKSTSWTKFKNAVNKAISFQEQLQK